MMSRRAALAVALGLSLLAAPLTARAQPKGKLYRIGLLGTGPPGPGTGAARLGDVLAQGLRNLGYVEGENLAFERRYGPEGQSDQLRRLADELVRLKVDVIVASGGLTPFAAKAATTTIPVVFTNHGDPVGSGLVASLARPGGNITGLSLLGRELIDKQLELLKQAVPRIVRIVVMSNSNNQGHPAMLKDAEAPARALGLKLQPLAVSGADYERAFATLSGSRPDALLVLGDPITFHHRARLAEVVTTLRLPGMFAQREFVEAGGLMSYGASLEDNFRRAASYVDKILKGAKAGDLPVEQPSRFELVISAKTARTLGLTIPQSVLARADRIIE